MKNSISLVLSVLALSACGITGINATAIKEVVSAPAAFEGKEVKLRGTVSSATKIPLIEIKMYTLKDDTGEITVITQNALPAENQKVTVTGTVESAAIVGGQSIGLRVNEKQRS